MNKVFVKIHWVAPEEGGRSMPPQGISYISVSRLKGQTLEDWKKNAWSIQLDFVDDDNQEAYIRYAFASFVSDKAPHAQLRPGITFDLYEGPRLVATAEVLLSEKMMENMARQMT
ncbi:MAG: hypothetical protein JNJ90_16150 [Saprospiraceae bacterium]|jgi:hypothetical protein|nr:hypothetical protein [Saprospiraceae bacterium]